MSLIDFHTRGSCRVTLLAVRCLLFTNLGFAATRLRKARLEPKPQGYSMVAPMSHNIMLATGDMPYTRIPFMQTSNGQSIAGSTVDVQDRGEDNSGTGSPTVPSISNRPTKMGSFESSAAMYSKSGETIEPILAPGLSMLNQAPPCVNPPCPEADAAAALNPFFPKPPESKRSSSKSSSTDKLDGYILGGLDGGVPIPGLSSTQ